MDFVNLKVKAELPYPQPVIPYKNPLEAKKLMNDYGGRDSETTAIMQYAYQSYILLQSSPEIAKKLEQIAIVEMHHHELLGTTISELGGFPVIGGKNSFWNGSYVNYINDIKKLLEANIQGEEIAIVNYEKTILVLQNESIKQLIERIILDEEQHIVVLKAMLEFVKNK
ncbi:MAG: manganese catalase family protein [Clostridia bacterium]